ncbi:sporulation protein [Lysinibacillus sp. LZ02]|uniref:sporulation protein n=1 Tax=Lysinibacillus sp. LZ02 TaxID=3420668 RepID=UPI003D36C34E
MFQKILASIGIGNAQVDTKLDRSRYTAGDVVNGVVEIKGGNTEQAIDTIYLTVYTTYIKEVNDTKIHDNAAVASFQVSSPFTIGAGELKSIPFSFNLPRTTPITGGKTQVWVQTELDIKMAVDPTDKDYIEVNPTPLANEVLAAVKRLGFRLRKVECEKAPLRIRTPHPFIQEFEFTATNPTYRRHLDELEVTFINQSTDSIDVLLQIDRRARGLGSLLSEALDMDESFVRLTFTDRDVFSIEQTLKQTIERYM